MFKIGDKVIYVNDVWPEHDNNPLWGGRHGYITGVIIDDSIGDTCHSLRWKVLWNNNKINSYRDEDLELWEGNLISFYSHYSQDIIDATKKCIEEKWKPIYEGTGIDKGYENCHLCLLLNNECSLCPINEYTGNACNTGKYKEWFDYFYNNKFYKGPKRVIDARSKGLACNMLHMLEIIYDNINKKEIFYSIGDRFIDKHNNIYVLNSIHENEVNLNNIKLGSRWNFKEIKVKNVNKITEQEFSQFCHYKDITKVL